MRLLNTTSGKIEEFFDDKIPGYAILSHTWGDEEISFQDVQNGGFEGKAGYQKIIFACRQAHSDLLNYIWIDTCCIDKSSSSELSEAINSMFTWYRRAVICYAYLADVPGDCPELDNNDYVFQVSNSDWPRIFSQSRWFTRGWTLQELLAPRNVLFYGSQWNYLGSKKQLCWSLSRITGISHRVLENIEAAREVCIATRMSWASRRETSRVEDRAYCLLGIFGVNMSMLYGEGRGAFFRLQQEIIKTSTDHSIFAWEIPTEIHESRQPLSGLFAPDVKFFYNGHKIIPRDGHEEHGSYDLTNMGLRIRVPLVAFPGGGGLGYLAVLNCCSEDDLSGPIALSLKKVTDGKFRVLKSQFRPRLTIVPWENTLEAKAQSILIMKRSTPQITLSNQIAVKLSFLNMDLERFKVVDAYPRSYWNNSSSILLASHPISACGVLLWDTRKRYIALGICLGVGKEGVTLYVYDGQQTDGKDAWWSRFGSLPDTYPRVYTVFSEHQTLLLSSAEKITANLERKELLGRHWNFVTVSYGRSDQEAS